MTEKRMWIATALTLVIVAAAGVAAVTGASQTRVAAGTDPVAEAAGGECLAEASGADIVHAMEVEPACDDAEPAAICRLMPECWSNSDCDDRCGAGQGKCIHSNCPVRICRCR